MPPTIPQIHTDLSRIRSGMRRSTVFQKLIWGMTGLFWLSALLNPIRMALNLFPKLPQSYMLSAYIFGVGVVVIFLGSRFFAKSFSKFKALEQKIVSQTIHSLFPSFRFTLAAPVPLRQINDSKLFPSLNTTTVAGIRAAYGMMKGKVADQEISIVDMGIQEETLVKKSKTLLYSVPIIGQLVVIYEFAVKNLFTSKTADNVYYTFRGLFAWTPITKKLEGRTLILPNYLGTSPLAESIKKLNLPEKELIQLESPDFARYFNVYATDQVEARYILDPLLMERIVELKERFGRPIMLSFVDGTMYVAIHNENGIFSFASQEAASDSAIEEIIEEINTTVGMVERLGVDR